MIRTATTAPTGVRAIAPQLGGLYAIWLREVKRAVRDRGQLIGGVSRPLLWVLIMGIGLNPYFRGEIYGEVRFVVPYTYLQFIFPAVIVLNIMYTSVQSAVSTIWDREFGFLREILVSPLSRTTILLGKVLGGATVALFHGCLVLVLARFVDVTLSPADLLYALVLMFLLAFGLTSLGVVIANRVQGFEGFGVFSNAVILPLYFTSSSIFPLDPSLTGAQSKVVYPEWLVTLVEINPLTYAVDALRGALIHFHQFDPRIGPIVLVVMAVVFFLIALRDFSRALSAMNVIASKVRQFAPYVLIFGLLGAVYLLPPDTSLGEVRKAGVLRACLPASYPPLVTGDRDAPGIDVEMLQALAKNLGVSLIISSNPAIGQDFNPRNWHVTRAQCEVLGGGVVASPLTKSFLETTAPYAQTGWALVGPTLPADLQGRRVGVLTGVSGLDRLALSSYLRARNAELTITPDVVEFVAGLRDGRFDIGITEWLLAGQLAAGNGWSVAWMPAELPRYAVALGLWKGDLTLKRAIADGLEKLRRDGEVARIIARYLGARAKGDAVRSIPSANLFAQDRTCEHAIGRREQAGDPSGGGNDCQQHGDERL